MSRKSSSSGNSSVIVGAVLLLGICGITAVFAYFYSQTTQNTPVVLPTSAAVAQLPTAEPTNPLQATNTPIPIEPVEGGVATVDNSIPLTETAVSQQEQEEEAQIYLTQTRPFIPTNTPRPTNTPLPSNTPVVTMTPSNTPLPTQVPNSAWNAEYFDNQDLSAPPLYYAVNSIIAFDWGTGSPGNGIPDDNFSARWQKTVAMSPGMHRFYVRADDGVRVWLNDQLIIDRWSEATDQTYNVDRDITAVNNTLRVEYYENIGDAQIQFWWEKLGDFTEWRGQYFTNKTLDNSGLALTRNDADINFQWGEGSPASGIPVDNFSVRWDRTINFATDRYRFFAEVDDGVRIYVDGKLIVEDWQDRGVRVVSGATNISQGDHIIIVEYYENISDAQIRVWWEKDVPTPTPTATATASAYP